MPSPSKDAAEVVIVAMIAIVILTAFMSPQNVAFATKLGAWSVFVTCCTLFLRWLFSLDIPKE